MTAIVAEGSFGRALAETLRTLLGADHCRVPPPGRLKAEDLGACLVGVGFAVRVSWRDVPNEFQAFAAAAEAVRVPWLGVASGPGRIRVGPLVVNGRAPCHDCFVRRTRQHEVDDRAEEIQHAYEALGELGVDGYAPHHVLLAAGQALALLEQAASPAISAVGEVRLIDCHTDEVARREVVPAQGCRSCDPEHDALAWAASRQAQLLDLVAGRADT
jgi:bacteriocin biosynthesis cyclodehydratase domain-containing protein